MTLSGACNILDIGFAYGRIRVGKSGNLNIVRDAAKRIVDKATAKAFMDIVDAHKATSDDADVRVALSWLFIFAN